MAVAQVAIFIDGGYLDKVLKAQFPGIRIDYGKLVTVIASRASPQAELMRSYYYHCLPYQGDQPTKEDADRFAAKSSFFHALRQIPRFEVKLGRLARRGPLPDGKYSYEQKMTDTLLSIDLVKHSAKGKMTHAAIIAGDGDFVPAVVSAKEESVVVSLFHGSKRHQELWYACDDRVRIDLSLMQQVALVTP
jgi:uncharacterized LabA/DUF88 family protein